MGFFVLGLVLLLLIALAVGLTAANDHGVFARRICGSTNVKVPKIIHLMYFPWDKEQRLLNDPEVFDHSYPLELQRRFPDFEVVMWTLPKVRSLVQKRYPGVWELAWANASRPTQLVDLYRWLVADSYGGIYVQFGSKINLLRAEELLPEHGFGVRLFTEFVWFSPFVRHWTKRFEIRKGVPEEKWRIMNQIFAAEPNHPYIRQTWTSILARMQRWKPQCDYDILFIGANAFVSELYDQEGSKRKDVQRTPFLQTRTDVTVSSKGSWRTDHLKQVKANIE